MGKTSKLDLTNHTYGRLTVLIYSHSDGKKRYWICKCSCGKLITRSVTALRTGDTKSCGCYRKDCDKKRKISTRLVNKKFGQLLVIEKSGASKDNKSIWKCKCNCGRITHVRCTDLTLNKTKSCGNCKLKRNKQNTSWHALQLHEMLNDSGIHNFKTKYKFCIDIAFVLNNQKFAIEYDEWYWHANKQDKDKKRYQKLIRHKWKVLRIKANLNLPTRIQLIKAMYILLFSNRKLYTIKLSGWGTGRRSPF